MSFWKTLKEMFFGPTLKTQFNDILEAHEKAVEALTPEAPAAPAAPVAETPAPAKPKRARTAKGKLKADNPATPEVNEAWEGGKAPAKKVAPKKKKK